MPDASRSCTPARSSSRAPIDELFREPRAPVHRGLLRSVPDVDLVRETLTTIPGRRPIAPPPPRLPVPSPLSASQRDSCSGHASRAARDRQGPRAACIRPASVADVRSEAGPLSVADGAARGQGPLKHFPLRGLGSAARSATF